MLPVSYSYYHNIHALIHVIDDNVDLADDADAAVLEALVQDSNQISRQFTLNLIQMIWLRVRPCPQSVAYQRVAIHPALALLLTVFLLVILVH